MTEAAMRAAQDARDRGWGFVDSAVYVGQQVEQERIRRQGQAIENFRRMNEEADDRLSLLRTELGLGRMGESQRERILRLEEMRLDLQRRFGPEHEAEIRQILAKAAAEDELRRHVEQVRDAQRELEQVGGNVIDELLNIDNWDNWGEAGKRVIHMLLQELITLAAINPLKNMLFGQNNPTIGSFIGQLGSLFGSAGAGGGDGAAALAALWDTPGFFAVGTHYAPGGAAWVGENGPELINLPRGSRVTPAAESRRMVGQATGPSVVVINTFDMNGAVVTDDLLYQMQEKADRAAVRGAELGVNRIFQLHRDTHGRLFNAY
jgi:hypothetical protein